MGKSTRKLKAKQEKKREDASQKNEKEMVKKTALNFTGFEHLPMDPTADLRVTQLEQYQRCQTCDLLTRFWCIKCVKVTYCTEKCREKDSERHIGQEGECIQKENVEICLKRVGNARVAELRTTKAVESGELLFTQFGLFWFPDPSVMMSCLNTENSENSQQHQNIVCYGCHNILTGLPNFKCTKCGLPVCGIDCESIGLHPDNECKVIQDLKKEDEVNVKRLIVNNDPTMQYIDICIIRVLVYFLDKKKLNTWLNFNKLRLTSRFSNFVRGMKDTLTPESFIQSQFGLSLKFAKGNRDLVWRINELISFFWDTISFRNYQHGVVYLHQSAMTQNCSPNAVITRDVYFSPFVQDQPMPMRAKALSCMKKGEIITCDFNGATPLFATTQQRSKLMQEKYCTCNCSRCTDPTECSTYVGSIRCEICESGMYVLKSVPRGNTEESECKSKLQKNLICDLCKDSISQDKHTLIVKDIEMKYLMAIEENLLVDPAYLEKCFIEAHQNGPLHSYHSLILESKYKYLKYCYSRDMWQFRIEEDVCLESLPEEVTEWIQNTVTPFPRTWDVDKLVEIYKRLEYAQDCLDYLTTVNQFSYAYMFLKREIAMDMLLIHFNQFANLVELKIKVSSANLINLICHIFAYTNDALRDYELFVLQKGNPDLLHILLQRQKEAIENLAKLNMTNVEEIIEVLARYYLQVPLENFALNPIPAMFGTEKLIDSPISQDSNVDYKAETKNSETVCQAQERNGLIVVPFTFSGNVDSHAKSSKTLKHSVGHIHYFNIGEAY